MNIRDALIEQLIKEKGGTREQYLSLMKQIAWHESAHTMDPTIRQIGGGPGRGMFQFEEGEAAGGVTAARRTRRYMKNKGMKIPKWLDEAASSNSLDASKLTAEQQEALFLGFHRGHPKADFAKVINGEESVEEFWANYHWAGKDSDRPDRLKSFNTSLSIYDPKKPIKSTSPDYKMNEYSQIAAQMQPIQDNIQPPQQINNQLAPPVNMGPHQLGDIATGESLYDYIGSRGNMKGEDFTEFNTGSTHDQNPLGGIPQGVGSNGKLNTVEEGEAKFDDFVFSNRIFTDGKIASNNKKNETNTLGYGGKYSHLFKI